MLTWKNNAGILHIALLVLLFIILSQTDNQVLGEVVSASSGTSLHEAGQAGTKEDIVEVAYYLAGGVQNEYNKCSYDAFSGKHKLYQPYRFGYRFLGWYEDRGLHKRIDEISTDQDSQYFLYAKWSPKIDNDYNIQNYDYQYKTGSIEKNLVLLKDLNYSFLEQIDIPGMPDTREDDFLNKYIFSESQCPQGICLTDEFVLITSYSTEDDCMGELMVFDRESGEYMVTLGMDENSHLGGIAFDGENVWVCNSYENTIERISYDFIQLMAYQNTNEVVDARDVVDEYPVKNTPSCITYYGERLWVATHTLMVNSKMVAYYFDTANEELVGLSEYKIPPQVQGITFDESGRVYLSTSYGRNQSSYLLSYISITDLATRPKHPALKVEMPPCSEEIDVEDDTLFVLFESAGEKYLEGTDGKGKSLSPIDKILMIPVEELN